jgi:SAM-dependent methyltransferase
VATALDWRGEDEFVLDGVEFGLRPGVSEPFDSTPGRFCLCKAPWAIDELERLLAELRPRRVIEVGIKQGGSTALISGLCELDKLVGIELSAERVAALDELARSRGIEQKLAIHYGVDQADAPALKRIAAEEFAGAPVDLVIDDASHMLAESRITFDALFPLLRPGGEYLLEDWSWAHMSLPVWPKRDPLTSLVFELIVACGHSPQAIAEVRVNRGWAVVRRGEAELDPETFRLVDLYGRRGEELLPAPGAATSAPAAAGGSRGPLARLKAGLGGR